MTLDEFKEYYQNEYGRKGMDDLDERLARVLEKGTSARDDDSVKETVSWNHAGAHVEGYILKVFENPDDGNPYCMTYEELLNEFCRPYYKDRTPAEPTT